MIQRVLVGGTASGKKAVARALFLRHGLRPLSMDSMKVYRGMDVGTDKPSAAMIAESGWGLLDLVGHDQPFSAGRWSAAAGLAVRETTRQVLFVGGTPLYLRLLLRGLFPGPPADAALRRELARRWDDEGEAAVRADLARLDPEADARLAAGDKRRVLRALEVRRLTGRPLSSWQREDTRPPVPGRFLVAALRWRPADALLRACRRIEHMLGRGLIEEVRGLAERAPFAREPERAIGYAEILAHLRGELDLEAAKERMLVRTRQLLRRQRIFLASFPEIRWIDVGGEGELGTVVSAAERALEL